MKRLRSLFLWTTGGGFFLLFFTLAAGGLLLLSPRRIFPMVRCLARLELFSVGVRFRVLGLETFKTDRAYLFLGNHQSLFDVFALPAALPTHAVGVEAAYHFSLPFWGYLTRKWGNIPIHRRDRSRAIESLNAARKALAGGTSIVILPEGHRTRTGAVGEFKKGPFHLALEAGTDIWPFAICGLYTFNRKGSFDLNPGPVTVIFGEPIPFDSFRNQSVEVLRDRVRNIVSHLSKQGELRR